MARTQISLDDGEYIAIQVALDQTIKQTSESLALGAIPLERREAVGLLFLDLLRTRDHLNGARITAEVEPFIRMN